jgi:hypothetical protein
MSHDPAPERLLLRLGGPAGPSYAVEWTGEVLRCERWEGFWGDGLATVDELQPDSEKWKRFWAAMDRIGVWDWAATYDDFMVMDGGSWSVELSYADRAVQTEGADSYPPDPLAPDELPDPLGLTSESDPTRTFRRFCAAVRGLVGDDRFG